MEGSHCECLDDMASRIDLSSALTNTESWVAPVSLSVQVLPDVSVSFV